MIKKHTNQEGYVAGYSLVYRVFADGRADRRSEGFGYRLVGTGVGPTTRLTDFRWARRLHSEGFS